MKSGIVAGILVLIIIAAVAFTVMNASGGGGGKVPEEVYNRPRKVYNMDSKAVEEVKTGDWEKKFDVDPQTGYRSNGGTTYAPVITCAACGKLAPAAPVPADALPEKMEEIHKEYKCPLCQGQAYQIEAAPAP